MQLILAIKTQIVYQMKDMVHGFLLVESFFEIALKKVEKSVYEYSIFWGVCGNPNTPGTWRFKVMLRMFQPHYQALSDILEMHCVDYSFV